MAVNFTKGQICNGTISKNICHKEYNLHGKFLNCITKCTTFALCRSTKTSVRVQTKIFIPGFTQLPKSLNGGGGEEEEEEEEEENNARLRIILLTGRTL